MMISADYQLQQVEIAYNFPRIMKLLQKDWMADIISCRCIATCASRIAEQVSGSTTRDNEVVHRETPKM